MSKTEKQLKDITDQLAHWAKKAKVAYPQHLEDALRGAIEKADTQGLRAASSEILATVEGKKKLAKQVRKNIGKSAGSLQRSYMKSAQNAAAPRSSGALYGLGVTALIIAACLATMWRATRSNNP